MSKARPPLHVDDSDKTQIRPDLSLRHPEDPSENERTRVQAPEWQGDAPESRTQVDIRSGENLKFAGPTVRAPLARPLTPPNPSPPLDLDSTRAMPEGGYQPPNLESTGSLPDVDRAHIAPLRLAPGSVSPPRPQRRKGVSFSPPSDNIPAFLETTATRFAPMATGNPDAAPLPFAEIPVPVQAPPDKSLDRKLMILAGVAVGLVLGAILLNIYG
ncbi:MAG: hypothetical protein KBF88_02500 [Polyangiaceae bacterium]|nr:hypothetical protein [Polyangiaceae bacterium]